MVKNAFVRSKLLRLYRQYGLPLVKEGEGGKGRRRRRRRRGGEKEEEGEEEGRKRGE